MAAAIPTGPFSSSRESAVLPPEVMLVSWSILLLGVILESMFHGVTGTMLRFVSENDI